VEQHRGWLKGAADLPADFSVKGKTIIALSGNLKDLNFDLQEAGVAPVKPYQSWSDVSFALAAIFKHDGRYTTEQIAAALLCNLECNEHIQRQADKRRTVERLILRSHAPPPGKVRTAGSPNWREQRRDGSPVPSMHNARLAIIALGVECSYDTFHNKLLFGFKDDNVRHAVEHIVGEVTDNGIIALRQLMSDTFGFDLTDKHTRDAVISLALEHCFDPVVDMLAGAEANWDGVKRLDRMAADYLNCEDTPLNAAFMRKTMIAAVARARNPGCKFDTIVVLEADEGLNKSTAWRVLAGDENFSDESILGKGSREVQEQLAGIWIHENTELAGMKKAEVEMVKAHASRQTDIARPAYGHFVKKQPRHSVEVGTTNSNQYLQSQTGNRRFWPLRVLKSIDIEKLRRDRLQLWGEAAHYQSQGESLVLDEKLWAEAGIEQEARRISDPWEDLLRDMPESVTVVVRLATAGYQEFKEKDVRIVHREGDEDKVAGAVLLEHVLKIAGGYQTTAHTMRLSTVMRKLGWERHNNGMVSIGGDRVKGYFRRS
jgi:predicted P-loop ATPase